MQKKFFDHQGLADFLMTKYLTPRDIRYVRRSRLGRFGIACITAGSGMVGLEFMFDRGALARAVQEAGIIR